HEAFLALLRENRRRDWRTALMQLCGVGWPRTRWRAGLRRTRVCLSLCAFFFEGVAFFPSGSSNTTSAQGLALLAPLPDPLTPLEGHYISVAVIVCLFAPGMFLWMQRMFRLADVAGLRATRAAPAPRARAHTGARRAA